MCSGMIAIMVEQKIISLTLQVVTHIVESNGLYRAVPVDRSSVNDRSSVKWAIRSSE